MTGHSKRPAEGKQQLHDQLCDASAHVKQLEEGGHKWQEQLPLAELELERARFACADRESGLWGALEELRLAGCWANEMVASYEAQLDARDRELREHQERPGGLAKPKVDEAQDAELQKARAALQKLQKRFDDLQEIAGAKVDKGELDASNAELRRTQGELGDARAELQRCSERLGKAEAAEAAAKQQAELEMGDLRRRLDTARCDLQSCKRELDKVKSTSTAAGAAGDSMAAKHKAELVALADQLETAKTELQASRLQQRSTQASEAATIAAIAAARRDAECKARREMESELSNLKRQLEAASRELHSCRGQQSAAQAGKKATMKAEAQPANGGREPLATTMGRPQAAAAEAHLPEVAAAASAVSAATAPGPPSRNKGSAFKKDSAVSLKTKGGRAAARDVGREAAAQRLSSLKRSMGKSQIFSMAFGAVLIVQIVLLVSWYAF